MIIKISTHTTIKQIQDTFAKRFPFLKIEFFIDANEDGIFTANEMIKEHDKTISEISKIALSNEVEIHGNHTITELEQLFKTNFGLIAQVFQIVQKPYYSTSHSAKTDSAKLIFF